MTSSACFNATYSASQPLDSILAACLLKFHPAKFEDMVIAAVVHWLKDYDVVEDQQIHWKERLYMLKETSVEAYRHTSTLSAYLRRIWRSEPTLNSRATLMADAMKPHAQLKEEMEDV